MKRTKTIHEGENTYILHRVQFWKVLGLTKLGAFFFCWFLFVCLFVFNVGKSIVVYLCPLQAGVLVRVTISQGRAIRFWFCLVFFFFHVVTGGYCKERTKKERVLCIYVQRVLSLHPQFFQSFPTNKASLLGPDEKARSMGEAGHLCAKELLG